MRLAKKKYNAELQKPNEDTLFSNDFYGKDDNQFISSQKSYSQQEGHKITPKVAKSHRMSRKNNK
jgi:hypothetical protein